MDTVEINSISDFLNSIKPPFRPIFRVVASREGSDIRILNEPLGAETEGSSVFLVETGEAPSLSAPKILSILRERRALAMVFK
jgi:hypothetical protein